MQVCHWKYEKGLSEVRDIFIQRMLRVEGERQQTSSYVKPTDKNDVFQVGSSSVVKPVLQHLDAFQSEGRKGCSVTGVCGTSLLG